MDTTEPKYVRMAESHSQDLRESPDEDCSRSAAVGTSGMKMGGTRSQELLLGGCKGLQKRKRKRRKRRKQEVAVSMATVSKATVSQNDSDLLDSSFKFASEDNRLKDSQQPSPCTATNVDIPSEDILEVLRTEAMRSKLDSNKLGKRPKPALQGTKEHGRPPSLKKARRRDRLSAGESDQEESPSAAQAAKRTRHEKSIPSELKLNTETTSSKDLSTSVQVSGNMKRRLKNAKNSKKLQTDVCTYTNPAVDKSIWLQAVQDVDMETGVLSQRRVVHGSRAKRQQQVSVCVANNIPPCMDVHTHYHYQVATTLLVEQQVGSDSLFRMIPPFL